ncbi:MAG: hypothetical protein ACYC8T_28450, partial [Myxococcaceae bacterium]
MATASSCPSCASPVFPDDFMCGNCDLILNPTAASGEYRVKEPTIVRALLSITGNAPSGEAPAERPAYPKVDRETTLKIAAPMDMQTFPRVIADLDIALAPLHAFEAYVISFLNGAQAVPEIARAAKIKQVEVEAVLRSLLERKLVELEHRLPEEARAAAPVQEPPAAIVAPESATAPVQDSVTGGPPDGAAAPVQASPEPAPAVPEPALPQTGPVRRRPAKSTLVTAPSTPPPPPSAASPADKPPPPVLTPGPAPKPPSPGEAAQIAPVVVSPSLRSERWPRAGTRAADVPRQPTPAAAPAPAPEPVPHAALAPALRVIPVRQAAAPPVERPESVLQKAIALEREGDVEGAVQVLER